MIHRYKFPSISYLSDFAPITVIHSHDAKDMRFIMFLIKIIIIYYYYPTMYNFTSLKY